MSGSWRCLSDVSSPGRKGGGRGSFCAKTAVRAACAGRAYTPLIIKAGVSKSSKTRRGCQPQKAQKNRGAGHGAPGNDSVHWSALLFPGFQTVKQNFFHVHRAFYLEILLCRLCSFTSPARQFGANDVTTLGYPSLGFDATLFRKAFSVCLVVRIGVLFGFHWIKTCCQPRLSIFWCLKTKLGTWFPAVCCSIPQSMFSRGPSAPLKTFLLCLTWTLPARSCHFARLVSAFGLRAFQKGTFPFMASTLELKPPCF